MSISVFGKLRQWMLNPTRVIDKLIFSEPVLEQMSTFGMKSTVMLYIFSGGFLFDEKVNKYFRGFHIIHFVLTAPMVWACCISYLMDLVKFDLQPVALGVMPLFWDTMWRLKLLVFFNNGKRIEEVVKFFSEERHESVEEMAENGFKKRDLRKWIVGLLISFVAGIIGMDVFYDPGQNMRRFTKSPYSVKFIPIWCPFESIYAKKMISVLADLIVLPSIISIMCTVPFLFILVADMMYNEIAMVCAKLRTSSEGAFDKIDLLERKVQRNLEEFDESVYSVLIEVSNEEKNRIMETFYKDFLLFVKRHQELKRVHQLIGQLVEKYGSMAYGFFSLLMVEDGFLAAKLLSNSEMKSDVVLVMCLTFSLLIGIWFLGCIGGSFYEEENEMFAEEVFSMPWYYLCPQYRKNVFVFLTIIQKPAELRMLKIFPLRRAFFHVFLNSVYSYIKYVDLLQVKTHS